MTAPRSSSFGGEAQEYDRVRLAPPAEIVTWMLAGDERTVLDLAAGTGQIARQLDRPGGPDVVAVEPDERMRAVLTDRCPRAAVLAGTAEDIPLPDASVDAVLVGSAWHWFDQAAAQAEIARVLRPGGRLGAVGCSADPYVAWVGELFDADRDAHMASIRAIYRDASLSPALFAPVRPHTVGTAVSLTTEGVRALFATHSSYLVADETEKARRDAVVARVLAARFPGAGRVDLPMRAWAWRTARR